VEDLARRDHQHRAGHRLARDVADHQRDRAVLGPGERVVEVAADPPCRRTVRRDLPADRHRQLAGNQRELHAPGDLELLLELDLPGLIPVKRGVLERHRTLVGHRLDQLEVVPAELLLGQLRSEGEHPVEALARAQRHQHPRAAPRQLVEHLAGARVERLSGSSTPSTPASPGAPSRPTAAARRRDRAARPGCRRRSRTRAPRAGTSAPIRGGAPRQAGRSACARRARARTPGPSRRSSPRPRAVRRTPRGRRSGRPVPAGAGAAGRTATR